MQVYRGLDIGTAKPTVEERQGIPHHLLDIVAPDAPFSVAVYQRLALEKIADIQRRGSVPILVGGTGFYINAVVYNTDFSAGTVDDMPLRDYYTKLAGERGAAFVHNMLSQRDPLAALGVHPSNIKRVARALAFIESTGTLFSAYNDEQRRKKGLLPNDIHFFVLDMPRDVLYSRINARTRVMLDAGFTREVAQLLDAGYAPHLPAMQSIGYKEVVHHLQCGGDPLALEAAITQSTRRYAKRQLTWFRNSTPHAQWVDASSANIENIVRQIKRSDYE
jgi:tRNA dimethylallyltransferase